MFILPATICLSGPASHPSRGAIHPKSRAALSGRCGAAAAAARAYLARAVLAFGITVFVRCTFASFL